MEARNESRAILLMAGWIIFIITAWRMLMP